MNRLLLLTMFASALAISIAACNGGGSTNPPAPGPTCKPPAGTQYALVYPAPGATAIPDVFGQIVIGASPALPSSWNVVVTTALSPGGVGGGTFQTATPPFPSPTASPSFANPTYQSSSFSGGNFPGEVVNVFLNNTSSNCTPLGPIGSFTTQ
jgi:hypothetical protein